MSLWDMVLGALGGATPTPADWDTVGPKPADHEPVKMSESLRAAHSAVPETPNHNPIEWAYGWWAGAVQRRMHVGRIGPAIVPRAVVVHSTDMVPGTFGAIVKRWTEKAGKGNGAHFLVGRNEDDGVVQFCPITRNANHAGGPTHGWFRHGRDDAAHQVHPNTVTVGIEFDCAGKLKWDTNLARAIHPDTGRVFQLEDVYVGPRGEPWHRYTDYQWLVARRLLTALRTQLQPWAHDSFVAPSGSYAKNGVAWAAQLGTKFVGHVTLDPINKTDPGPQFAEWMKKEGFQ